MSRRDLFDRTLQALHAAAFDEARWPRASGLVDELAGVQGSLLVHADRAVPVHFHFVQLCARGERRRDLERIYYRDYYPIDERVPRMRRLPDARSTPAAALSTEAERKTSRVWNELLPRLRGRDGLFVRLDGPEGSHTVWAIGDPVDREGWTRERLATVARLLPHLRHFVAVRHALLRTRALGASLIDLLDHVRACVIRLDRRGRVTAASDRARTLLRRGAGLHDRDGRLRAALPGEDAALQGLIARALPAPGGSGEGGSIRLARPGTPSRLVVHVGPLHDPAIEAGRGGAGALLLAVDPADRAGIDPGRVGRALGLTPAESRVAVALAEGMTVDGIAARTGRSPNTVRWHLQRIYAALGVSRRIELAQLVASLADLPGARG